MAETLNHDSFESGIIKLKENVNVQMYNEKSLLILF